MEVNISNIYIICIEYSRCVPVLVFCCYDELLIENTTKFGNIGRKNNHHFVVNSF